MNDADALKVLHCACDLNGARDETGRAELVYRVLLQHLQEVAVLQELDDHPVGLVLGNNGKQSHHMRVLERGECLGFHEELAVCLTVTSNLETLDCNSQGCGIFVSLHSTQTHFAKGTRSQLAFDNDRVAGNLQCSKLEDCLDRGKVHSGLLIGRLGIMRP